MKKKKDRGGSENTEPLKGPRKYRLVQIHEGGNSNCGVFDSYDDAYIRAVEYSPFSGVCIMLRGSFCDCESQHYYIDIIDENSGLAYR